MKASSRALFAFAIAFASLLRSDPAAALGIEVPVASCVAQSADAAAPYGGPTPPDWQTAGRLSCERFAAAHLPVGCSGCSLNGTICSTVASCMVQSIGPTFVGGGERIPGTVLLSVTGNLPGCTITQDLGQRQVFNCSCPNFAGFGADNRCYCLDGFVWNPATRSCTVTCNQKLTEGHCLPSTPGKDCADCPLRGDVTAGTNPINVATGIKFEPETYYRSASPHGLSIGAVFASGTSVGGQPFRLGIFGRNRTSAFDRAIRDIAGTGAAHAFAVRPDGRRLDFRRSGGAYIADPDVADRLERTSETPGYRYRAAERDMVEVYSASGALLFEEDRHGRRLTHTYADGSGGPACTPPQGWIYQVDARGEPAAGPLPAGRLLCVTDHFGRQLHFQYDPAGRATRIADPAAGVYRFSYDGASGGCNGELDNFACVAGNLTGVEFPDGKRRTYHYNELESVNGGAACAGKPAFSPGRAHLPNHLTGLIDEKGIRFATWTYDCEGRATSSQHADGADRVLVAYDKPSAGQSTVTDPKQSRVYSFTVSHGVSRNTALSHPNAAGGGGAASHGYDGNGNIASRTDWNGNRTNYAYDLARNLETSRTEGLTASGAPTPQTRTISTEWHATFRLPHRHRRAAAHHDLTYDPNGTHCGARGALCSRASRRRPTPTARRASRRTASGAPRDLDLHLQRERRGADGQRPAHRRGRRHDVHVLRQQRRRLGKRGNVATITNAAGHTTSITAYNAHGQPLTIVDANGLDHHAGLRRAPAADVAHGRRRDHHATTTTASASSPRSRCPTARSSPTPTTTRTASPRSRTTSATASPTRSTRWATARSRRCAIPANAARADAKPRVQQPEPPVPGARRAEPDHRVHLRRPGQRHLGQGPAQPRHHQPVRRAQPPEAGHSPAPISASRSTPTTASTRSSRSPIPRSLVTGYTVDGLGNLTRRSSPDTGTTTNTYDAAGNLLTQTDAKSQVTTYAYDALNRVTLDHLPRRLEAGLRLRPGPNGIGRLSSITERNPARSGDERHRLRLRPARARHSPRRARSAASSTCSPTATTAPGG